MNSLAQTDKFPAPCPDSLPHDFSGPPAVIEAPAWTPGKYARKSGERCLETPEGLEIQVSYRVLLGGILFGRPNAYLSARINGSDIKGRGVTWDMPRNFRMDSPPLKVEKEIYSFIGRVINAENELPETNSNHVRLLIEAISDLTGITSLTFEGFQEVKTEEAMAASNCGQSLGKKSARVKLPGLPEELSAVLSKISLAGKAATAAEEPSLSPRELLERCWVTMDNQEALDLLIAAVSTAPIASLKFEWKDDGRRGLRGVSTVSLPSEGIVISVSEPGDYDRQKLTKVVTPKGEFVGDAAKAVNEAIIAKVQERLLNFEIDTRNQKRLQILKALASIGDLKLPDVRLNEWCENPEDYFTKAGFPGADLFRKGGGGFQQGKEFFLTVYELWLGENRLIVAERSRGTLPNGNPLDPIYEVLTSYSMGLEKLQSDTVWVGETFTDALIASGVDSIEAAEAVSQSAPKLFALLRNAHKNGAE